MAAMPHEEGVQPGKEVFRQKHWGRAVMDEHKLYQLNGVVYKDILDIPELDIPENKVTCIYGESGAGKSTLLRLLNHLLSPDSGSISLRGVDISGMDPIELRRRVLMLPQNPLVYPGSIRDNLNIGIRFSGRKHCPGDHALKEVLDTSSLNKPLDTDAKTLSGGEKQRLALARLFLLDPEVLLLDEPSASLDGATERTVIANAVTYAKEQRKSLIMVSHAQHLVDEFGEAVVELARGTVSRSGKGGSP